MKKTILFFLILFGLNLSAEDDVQMEVQLGDVRIGIENREGEVWIQVEGSKEARLLIEPIKPELRWGQYRDALWRMSWDRYPGDKKCGWLQQSCREMCETIYKQEINQILCKQLPQTQVEKLREVDRHLSSFKKESLEAIHHLDFKLFATIDGPENLRYHIERFSFSEKRIFLAWMAMNVPVMRGVKHEDNNGDLLEKLLEGINVERTSMGKDFATDIFDGKSFIELAITAIITRDPRESALKWMVSVLENRCYARDDYKNSHDDLILCVFKEGFCKMDLPEASWEAFLHTRHSLQQVGNILNNFTTETPPDWWSDGVSSALPKDFGVAEFKALCTMNLVKKNQ